MPPRAVEKRRCSAPISASGQLKKRPCDTLASGAKADYGRFGWVVGKNVRENPKRARRASIRLFAIFVIGAAAVLPQPASSGPKDDTTGTVSRAEPAVKQDGTPAHPYADASQCPSSTDLIIWPNGRSVPSLPPGISVCFVGSQSFNDSASDVRVRQR
jgi:hypothetical protein